MIFLSSVVVCNCTFEVPIIGGEKLSGLWHVLAPIRLLLKPKRCTCRFEVLANAVNRAMRVSWSEVSAMMESVEGGVG